MTVGRIAHAACLAVLFVALAAALRAGDDAVTPPILVRGQVLGSAPTSLALVLEDGADRTPLTTVPATLVTTASTVGWIGQLPADAWAAAGARGRALALSFVADGRRSAAPLAIGTGPVPFVVHALSGEPALPQADVVLARITSAGTDSPVVTGTAVIVSTPAQSGLASFAPAAPGLVATTATATLAAGAVTVVRATSSAATNGASHSRWTFSFTPSDPSAPVLFRSLSMVQVDAVVVDALGDGPALASVPALIPSTSGYQLTPAPVSLAAGELLLVDLESSASVPDVRTTLAGWTLGDQPAASAEATTAPFALTLSVAAVEPTTSGCWVSASVKVPADTSWKGVWLRGGAPGSRLPGEWRVRSIVTGFGISGEHY